MWLRYKKNMTKIWYISKIYEKYNLSTKKYDQDSINVTKVSSYKKCNL